MRAVNLDHRRVNLALVFGVEPDQLLAQFVVHGGDSLQHALAEIAALVAVAQFNRLVRAGAGARGHCGAAETAILQQHINLHRRVAPAVEDFAGVDVDDLGHGGLTSVTAMRAPIPAGRGQARRIRTCEKASASPL